MEMNTPPGDKSQEPSVWDRVDALTPKKRDIWDQVESFQPDQKRAQAGFILQEGAKRDPERAAKAIRLSNRFKLPEAFAEQNLDRLEEEERKGNLASEDLVNRNPVLAEAISKSPNYSAGALKHLPALKQLEMLYTKPQALWTPSESAMQAEARGAAKIMAERNWKEQGGKARTRDVFPSSETGPDPFYASSQQEMEDMLYERELEGIRGDWAFISGDGQVGFKESITETNRRNPLFMVPIASHAKKVMENASVSLSSDRVKAGQADDLDRYILNRAARLEAAANMRGKSFWGYLGEAGAAFPAMAGEFGMGGVIGRGAKTLFGLAGTSLTSKVAGAVLESAAGAVTAGAPGAVEVFQHNKMSGDSDTAAAAKAARDAFADYLGNQLFGPWFSKATPEVQALVKTNLITAVPKEALKMVGMTAASDLMKAVGPDLAKNFNHTLVMRAIDGDPEAWKELGAQATIGGLSGAAHGLARNRSIDHATATAEAYANAALERSKLLEGVFKESPDLAAHVADTLAKAGPGGQTLVPVQAFIEHYGPEARAKVTEMLGDPAKFDRAKEAGRDLVIPTSQFDRVIGMDQAAIKFFANEIRPEPDAMNLREAQALEKAYAAGMRIPPRQRIVDQIVEQAKGDKINEAVSLAEFAHGDDKVFYDTLGLSDQQMADIGVTLGRAREAAKEAVNAKEIERRDRLKGALYEKEKARLEEEATKEVDARREQIALARLQRHELPGGQILAEDLPKIKLSRQSLEDAGYKVSTLPKGVVADGNFSSWGDTSTHGHVVPLEDAASMLGFNSGHELVMALAGLHGKAREEAIKYETDSRLAQKFPLGLQPSELPDAALDALHNKHSAELQRLTLQHIVENKLTHLQDMVKVASRKVPRMEEVTAAALADVRDNFTLDTLDPKVFLEAERRAKKEAMAAAMTGRWEDVFDRKLEELHAHEGYRAALDATEEVKRLLPAWEKLPEASYLNKPGVYDWGQQAKNLLRRIGLVAVDPKELEGRKPINVWAREMFDAGNTRLEPIRIDEKWANEEFQTTYKEMTYGDVISLKDTIDQITHLAKDIDKVQTAAKRVSVESWVESARESVSKGFKKRPVEPLTDSSASPLDKAIKWAKEFDATLDRPEALFDRLDNKDIQGPFNEGLWQGQVEARVKEADLKRRFTESLRKAVDEMPKEIQRHLDDRIQMDGLNVPVTRREVMAMVANGGNESNYSKMTRGEEIRKSGLTHQKIQELAKKLTTAELDYVQKLLDITNQFWPEIEALHKWATGKAPDKIVAKQMIEAMGDRKGGYYPAMYDRNYSKAGEVQISGELGKLVDPSWRPATTDAGYRKGRVEEFAAPMDFNFNRLASHMDAMAKDIAFRRWLTDVNRLVNNPEVMNTMRDYLGPEFKNYLSEWVKRVLRVENSTSASASKWTKGISTLRHNVTMARLALKPAVFLKNAFGIGPAITEVGMKWFAKGYGEFIAHPRDTFNRVVSESKEMAHFLDTFDANIRQSLDRLGTKTGMLADVQRFAMKVIPWGNMILSMPTYLGAKARANAELSTKGKTGAELEKLSIRAAEKAVRKAVGSGNPGDLPAVMTSDGMKLLLMFYTPGSVMYAQMKDAVHDVKRSGDISQFLFKAFWLLPATAAINTLLSGRTPDEDRDETWTGNIARDTISQAFSAIPLGSELSRKGVDAVMGDKGRDYTITSPAFSAFEETFESIDKTADWFRDEREFEEVARQMFKTSGFWLGAPTEQLEISGGYLFDLARSKGGDPNDLFEFFHDLLWRRPKSRR